MYYVQQSYFPCNNQQRVQSVLSWNFNDSRLLIKSHYQCSGTCDSLKCYTPSVTLYSRLKWLTAILPNLCSYTWIHTYVGPMAHAWGCIFIATNNYTYMYTFFPLSEDFWRVTKRQTNMCLLTWTSTYKNLGYCLYSTANGACRWNTTSPRPHHSMCSNWTTQLICKHFICCSQYG